MAILSFTRLIVYVLCLVSFVSLADAQQIPDDLPLDDATRAYLESLPPDKLEAILAIYLKGLEGQIPAPASVIKQQELIWSYGRSPPVYPSREFRLPRPFFLVIRDLLPRISNR